MSSQTEQSGQLDNSPYLMGVFAKLNALRETHHITKKRYNSAVAHNEELKFSLGRAKADLKKLTTSYTNMVESEASHLLEIERLKSECDILKRKNNLCIKHEPEKDILIASLRAELSARDAELDAVWARNQSESIAKRIRN